MTRTSRQESLTMPNLWKIAGVQMDVRLGDKAANLQRLNQALAETSQAGAQLTVFPECALPGYCFDDIDEARALAEPIPGPSVQAVAEMAARHRQFVVFGLLESDGERIFNACALLGPAGLVGSYRKAHLPYLGVDRFTTPGDRPFEVFDAAGLRVGMNICYDGAFPEAARALALAGADLIVLPTNWPPGAQCTADFVINTRAMENNVYYMAVNRVGTERGFEFIGRSKICDPSGCTIAEAAHARETVLYASIDLDRARRKKIIRVPDKHEIHRFEDRRPDLYGPLVAPIDRNPPH